MPLFPFPVIRPGQKEFIADIETALEERRPLVAHAPTGIGKTAAVLSAVLPFALENGKPIFFLTPKHTQHAIVIETLKKIKNKFNINFRVADIIGKQWLCPVKGAELLSSREFNQFCSTRKKNEECRFYNNFFKDNKISDGAKDAIKEIKKNILHAHEVKMLCKKSRLCPYEVCIKAGSSANVITADYYHIFSPKVRRAFLAKLNKDMENIILIIDEAHNLPDRIRHILSYNLSEYTLRGAIKEARVLKNPIEDDFFDLIDILKKFEKEKLKKKDVKFSEVYIKREEFTSEIEKFASKMKMSYEDFYIMVDNFGDEVLKIPRRYRSYSKTAARFLESWNKPGVEFARILRKNKRNEMLELSYKCLDPSVSSAGVFSGCFCSILMSGTLVPLNMYSSILGLANAIEKEYASPYPKENKLVLITPGVTTQWKKRSDEMYEKYAEKLKNIIDIIPGNTAVFFPSYEILNKIHKIIENNYEIEKNILAEKQDMKQI
ncbi:hypothetical protein BEH94_09220, partial [Candidatus Altiarchaeales archaeon WOR_SM1_SCG]